MDGRVASAPAFLFTVSGGPTNHRLLWLAPELVNRPNPFHEANMTKGCGKPHGGKPKPKPGK